MDFREEMGSFWKRILITSIIGLVLILSFGFIPSVNAAPDYNFTFDGGSDEGFTKFVSANANPSFEDNNYQSASSTDFGSVAKNVSLTQAFNVTMLFNMGTSYIRFGYYNAITKANWDSHGVSLQPTAMIFKNEAGTDVVACSGFSSISSGTLEWRVLGNGTWEVYRNNVLTCQGDMGYTLDAGDDVLWLGSRKSSAFIDDVSIELTGTGGSPPATTCTCPGAGSDWEIDLSENCRINTACNITTGAITYTGSGAVWFNNTIVAKKMTLSANSVTWLGKLARLRLMVV